MLRIFSRISTLYEYLQTKKLDHISAYNQVSVAITELQKGARDFNSVLNLAKSFVPRVEEDQDAIFERLNPEFGRDDLAMEDSLPEHRQRKRKRMAGKIAEDEAAALPPENQFEVSL